MRKVLTRLFLLICLLLMLMSLVACNIKQKIGEKLIENALGNNVDINGDEIKIKGENGQEVTYGSKKWPDSELAKKIPKFEKGTIEGTFVDKKAIIISMQDVKEADFNSYLEKIKEKFPVDGNEYKAEDLITYSGSNDKKVTVHISLVISEKVASIQIMDENE